MLGRTSNFIDGDEAVVHVTDGIFEALRHYRASELLEFKREVQFAPVDHLVETSTFEEQGIAQEIKDTFRHAGIQALGIADGGLDVPLIACGVFAALVNVSAIYREARDGFPDAVAQSFESEIACAAVAGRDLSQKMREHVHLARQRVMHHELLALIYQRLDVCDLACEPEINPIKRPLVCLLYE